MKLTKKHAPRIKEALEAGRSYRSIADELGCDKTTVSTFAKLHFPTLRRRPQQSDPQPAPEMKILVIDIETRPNLAYVWDIWNQNIGVSQIVESVEMICFAAKWLGDDGVFFRSVHHHSHREMIEFAWQLLDKADAVMHYNGKRFDVPHIYREFVTAEILPPSPFKQIDLLATVRRQFKFPSNKLAYVSEALGLPGKVEHEGFALWLKCMAGDNDAWDRMHAYNVQDVQLVEDLYYKLLPWIEQHPSYGAIKGDDSCPNCGSAELEQYGYAHTRVSKFVQYRCGACGKYCRDTKRVDKTARSEVIS